MPGLFWPRDQGREKRAYVFMPEHEQAMDFQPDIVVCNLGVNDLMDWEAFGKEDFVDDYRALIQTYKELPGKPRVVVWNRLTPLFPGQAFYGDRNVDEINDAIGEVIRLEEVEAIDLERPMKNHGDWFPDGLHPNAEGASAIAKIVAACLSQKK